MGILNVTPDSFFDGGRYTDLQAIATRVGQMLDQGATFIDIGGASSKPGSNPISTQEEIDRVQPAIETILKTFPQSLISVDTTNSKVALEAVGAGAVIVNDISAGKMDHLMMKTVADLAVPYIAMHMQGTPKTMQKNPQYRDVVKDVMAAFIDIQKRTKAAGIKEVIIDPGFGFGKTLAHNYQLLYQLEKFKEIGCPILIGVSRKSMIQKVIGVDSTDALHGSSVVHTIAALKGASVLRTHDVKEAVEVIRLVNFMNQQHKK
jgi:dihydropteroate synthase